MAAAQPSPPAGPDPSASVLHQVERYLTIGPEWLHGIEDIRLPGSFYAHMAPTVSIPVDKASTVQRSAALRVLADYGIAATIQTSRSLGNVEVIRVRGNSVAKLALIRHLSDPASWVENTKAAADGSRVPCLNVRIISDAGTPKDNERATQYAIEVLRGRGIDAAETFSQSLGNVRVLRVEGREQIERLRSGLAGLGEKPRRPPDYPTDTHSHTTAEDGTHIVRLRSASGTGKIDNPIGPAVSGPGGDRFALDGRMMDYSEWSENTSAPAAQGAPNA